MHAKVKARRTGRLEHLQRPGANYPSTLPIPEEHEIGTKPPSSRAERRKMWELAQRSPLGPHETVDWLQWKLLKQRGKKKTKKRAKALLRLRELRARDNAGSTHKSDGGDTSRTTEDLIDEADWREAVGKEW
ncbi:hypothetical protein DFH06DRAFT_1151908 [Mycena polygramma]|nr:hypothetical protein DFH06DRAFT_1151908 [Mycena polygramma]